MSSAFGGFPSSGFNFFNASQDDKKSKSLRFDKNDNNNGSQQNNNFNRNKGKPFTSNSNNRGPFFENVSSKGDGKNRGSFSTSKEKSPVRTSRFSDRSNTKTSSDPLNKQKQSLTKQNFGNNNHNTGTAHFKNKNYGSFQALDKKGNYMSTKSKFNAENSGSNSVTRDNKTNNNYTSGGKSNTNTTTTTTTTNNNNNNKTNKNNNKVNSFNTNETKPKIINEQKNKKKKNIIHNDNKLTLNPLPHEKENSLGPLLPNPDQNGFFKHDINQRELPKFMIRERAQLLPTEFKQDQWDKANQLKMLQMEETSSGDTQDLYDMFRKMRVMERKMMENKKLVDKAEESKDLSEAIVFQGTCLDMCPIFERTRRSLENNVSNLEKIDGKISREKAIKAFARPAASAPPSLPSDVRPPHVLMKTLDYIVDNVIGNLPEGEPFLWDRMRSIRQDFTYQNYCGPEAVDCNERICRIHLLILHIMAKSNAEYSKQQEIEQLTKALITLCEIYDDARNAGLNLPNEPEFRAYWLLHNIRDSECDYVIQNLPLEVINNKSVQLALAFRRIVSNSNFKDRGHISTPNGLNLYKSFFKLLSDPKTPFLMASFLENYINEIRFYGFLQMKSSTNKKLKPIPFQFFIETFRFNNFQELIDFCHYYSVDIEGSDHVVIQSLEHTNHLLPEKSPLKQAWLQCVDEKMIQLGDFKNIINVGKSNFNKDYLINKHFGISMSQTSSVEDLDEEKMVENGNEAVGAKLSEPVTKPDLTGSNRDLKADGALVSHSRGDIAINTGKSLFGKGTLTKSFNEPKPSEQSVFSLGNKTTPVAKFDVSSKDAFFDNISLGLKRDQSTTPTPQARDVNKGFAKPSKDELDNMENVSKNYKDKAPIFSQRSFNSELPANHAILPDMSNNVGEFGLRRVTDQQYSIGLSNETETNEQVKKIIPSRQIKSTSVQQTAKTVKFSQNDLIQARRAQVIETMNEEQITNFCHQEIGEIIKENMAKYQIRESKLNSIAEELYTAFLREQVYMTYLEARAIVQCRKVSQRRWLKRWQVKLQHEVEHKAKTKRLQMDILKVEKSIGVPSKRCVSLDYFLKNQQGSPTIGGSFNSLGNNGRGGQLLTPIKNEKREISLLGCSCKIDLYQDYLEPILGTKQSLIKYCNLKNVGIDISIFSDNWKDTSSKWLYENMHIGMKVNAGDDLSLSVKGYDFDHVFDSNEQCNTQLLIFNTGVTGEDIFDLENKLKKDGEMLISLLNSKNFMKNHYRFNILLLYWESVDTKYDVNELYEFFQLSKIFEIFGHTLVKRIDFLKIKNKKSMENLKIGLKEIALDFKFDLTNDSGIPYFDYLKKQQRQEDNFSNKRLVSSLLRGNNDFDDASQGFMIKKNKIDDKLQKMLKEEQMKYMQQKTANQKNTFQFMKRYPKKNVLQDKSNRKVSVLNSDAELNETPRGITNSMHQMNNIAEEESFDDGNDESLIDSSYHSVIGPSKSSGQYIRPAIDSPVGIPVVTQLDERSKKLIRNLTFNYNGSKEDGLYEINGPQSKESNVKNGNSLPFIKTPTFESGSTTPSELMKRPLSHFFTPTILRKNATKQGERSFSSSMRTPSSRVVSINRLINGDNNSSKSNEPLFSNAPTVRKHKPYGKRISSVSSNASSVSELKNLVDSVVKKLENV